MIASDIKYKTYTFYGHCTPGKFMRVLFTDGTSAVVLFRLAKFFQRMGLGVVGWLILELNKFFNGCVIGRGVEFGPGFVLMHPVGVVINGSVRGGDNIVIESGVVIGVARNGLPVKVPVLGNNIFIGAGAKVLGGIAIGNNVKIGANAVVIHDVPDGATVVGIPAKALGDSKSRLGPMA